MQAYTYTFLSRTHAHTWANSETHPPHCCCYKHSRTLQTAAFKRWYKQSRPALAEHPSGDAGKLLYSTSAYH